VRPAESPGGVLGGYPHAFTESTLTVLHCSLPRPTRLPMPNQADVVRTRRPPRRLARHPARRRLVPDERSAEAWHPCALQGRAATPFRGFFGVVVQDGLHVKSAVGARRLTTGTLVERERSAQPAAGGRRERDQRPRPLLVAFGLLRRPASATPGEAQASPGRWCVEAADRRRGTTNRRVEPTRSVARMEAASRRSRRQSSVRCGTGGCLAGLLLAVRPTARCASSRAFSDAHTETSIRRPDHCAVTSVAVSDRGSFCEILSRSPTDRTAVPGWDDLRCSLLWRRCPTFASSPLACASRPQ
jgi:hypothetical protein